MEEEEALRDEVVVAWEEDTAWRAQLGQAAEVQGGPFGHRTRLGLGWCAGS